MNNLKKVLALGLALVMLLGMFTIASAAETKMVASDLSDWNTVKHTDAVSLMVDLGIINGKDDGTFDPTGNIDRASWAKMVYYAATGSDTVTGFNGTTKLKDVKGNWAEAYIAFLEAGKYISGDTYGNYNPSKSVTVAEACKMMLTVLGYDAQDRGYQNNDAWSLNIMSDAKRNGLMDNVDKNMDALVPLTRENAAEIVYNALNANMVEGIPQWDQGNRYVTTYNKLTTLGYDVFKLIRVTATVQSIDPATGYAVFSSVSDPSGINTGNINNKIKANAKQVGEEVVVYVEGKNAHWNENGEQEGNVDFVKVISSSVATLGNTPIKVITGGIRAWGDLKSTSSSNYVSVDWASAVTYYLNGELSNQDAVSLASNTTNGRGTVVEFYSNDKGEVSIVKAYKYTVARLETGDAETRTSGGTLQVRVPGVTSGYVDADKVTGYQGLVEGDVVLYYKTGTGANTTYTIEKAEKLTGKVSTWSETTLTVGGKTYRVTQQSGANIRESEISSTFEDKTVEYDFFLDKNGSICWAEQLTDSLDQSKIALVLGTEQIESTLGSAGKLKAELLFVDGTTAIVDITKVDSKTIIANEKTASDRQITVDDAEDVLVADGYLTRFFNYKSTTAGYELIDLNGEDKTWSDAQSDGDADATTGSYEIVKLGNFLVGGENVTLKADDTTTFIVGKYNSTSDTFTYSVHKGFSNVPEMKAGIVTAIANIKDSETVAKYVYVQSDRFTDDAPDGYVFILDNKWTSDPELEDTYLVNIIDVNGEKDVMRVDYNLKQTIASESLKLDTYNSNKYVGRFCEIVAIDENGVVSALGNGDGSERSGVPTKDLTGLGNSVITTADDSYTYTSATKFVYVDLGWADDENDASNEIGVREADKDEITFVGSGSFTSSSANNFFRLNEVGDEGSFVSVKVAVIKTSTDTKAAAEYVYIVREQW